MAKKSSPCALWLKNLPLAREDFVWFGRRGKLMEDKMGKADIAVILQKNPFAFTSFAKCADSAH